MMTIDQIRNAAPAAFAVNAAEGMSDRYAHVTTANVLDALQQDGWVVTDARQRRSRRTSNREHGAHAITLTHPSLPEHAEGRPQMYLGNAGNGESAYRQIGGFLRTACLNQLYTGIRVVGGVFHHRGNGLEDRIVANARNLCANFDKVLSVVDLWREIELSPAMQQEFAIRAIQTRWTGDEVVSFDSKKFLLPVRAADTTGNLWSTFNIAQERLMRGGFMVESPVREGERIVGHRWRNVRQTTGLSAERRINEGLWNLAEEFQKAVTV